MNNNFRTYIPYSFLELYPLIKNEAAFWVPKVFFDFSFFSFNFEHEFARKFKRYHTQRHFRIDITIESSLNVD